MVSQQVYASWGPHQDTPLLQPVPWLQEEADRAAALAEKLGAPGGGATAHVPHSHLPSSTIVDHDLQSLTFKIGSFTLANLGVKIHHPKIQYLVYQVRVNCVTSHVIPWSIQAFFLGYTSLAFLGYLVRFMIFLVLIVGGLPPMNKQLGDMPNVYSIYVSYIPNNSTTIPSNIRCK